jgi:hypothetical protein
MSKRISKPKYISIQPEVLAMAERLCAKLHVNFSQLVTRLIVEGNNKIFNGELPKIELPKDEVDPLS